MKMSKTGYITMCFVVLVVVTGVFQFFFGIDSSVSLLALILIALVCIFTLLKDIRDHMVPVNKD